MPCFLPRFFTKKLAAKENSPPTVSPTERRINSKSLLGNEGRVIIEYGGQHYLLRQTLAGKLILTT
ncbi:hemin uptake protein HemP [Salmonella enterica subsp. enterica serovar Saintpaul]|nr:hemin uptake protein HemP [Salmonella enterica subsp. enterica serovar Saintpaul]